MKFPPVQIILVAGILLNTPLYGLLKGITETAEKITDGVTKTAERVTGAVVPPAEKVVEVPSEVARKTVSGVADLFRDSYFRITNKDDKPLHVEIKRADNTIEKTVSLDKDKTLTLSSIPHAVELSYKEIKTGLVFDKKLFKNRPIDLRTTLSWGKIRLRPDGEKKRNITRAELRTAKKEYDKVKEKLPANTK